MEKVNKRVILLIIAVLSITLSCDKNERAYKKFIDEGRWVVTELTAGTTSYTKLPKWEISPCENHETLCEAQWEHQNGSSVKFYYEFLNLGGRFHFYVDPFEYDTSTMAYSQCYNFSGSYSILKSKHNTMHFESEETAGFSGVLVTIRIEKE